MKLRRALVFAGLVAAHLLILGLVLRPVLSARRTEPSIAVVAVAAPSPLPPAAPPIAELAVETSVAPPELADDGGGGSGCEVGEAIRLAIAADDAALEALAAIPAAERSVANTAMVWDGGWPAAARANDPMRIVVSAAIRAASDECRTAPLIGPRLVFVPESGGIALAFGSGRWSWNDLVK